jgi:hypothetical protein
MARDDRATAPTDGRGATTEATGSDPAVRYTQLLMQYEQREDLFDNERKRLFLLALRNGATVLSACRMVGISNRTAYNHRQADPEFSNSWQLARQMARMPLELAAFERGVVGIAEPVYVQGQYAYDRRRYSDSLLRTLLQGEQPAKYGRGAGAPARLQAQETRIAALVAEQVVAALAAVKVVNPLPEEKTLLSQEEEVCAPAFPALESADFPDNREAAGETPVSSPGPDPSAAPRSSS